jgi:hypothetical protein
LLISIIVLIPQNESKVKIQMQPANSAHRQVGLIYAILVLTLFLTARYAVNLLSWMPPCPFRALTGIPCPICGATRAGICLAQFQWSRAFFENPLFFLLYMTLIAWGLFSLTFLPAHKMQSIKLNNREKKLAYKLLVFMLLLNWAYLIIMRTF